MEMLRWASVAFVGAVLAAWPAVSRADLYLSEFLASNVAGLADEDGEFSDWIEVYNDASSPVDLAGYSLTDDAALPAKWTFPSVTLVAQGRLVVFASDKNRAAAGYPLHTNFKLSSGGEYLAIVRPDGVTVEHAWSPSYPAQSADVSWGLASDLSQQRCFLHPTPGAANDESTSCGTVDEIVFSTVRGFPTSPFQLTLSTATPGATIRYTLDGSEPDQAHGIPYSAPIDIGTTAMVRAVAYAPPLQPRASVTHSYLFLADVVRQTGAGFPTGSFGDDYAMDSRVVDDPRYAATFLEDMRAVPTVSIVMNLEDLFGQENGIYTHPRARGIDWERRASAELIRSDGSTGFQINCGVRIQGRLSREKNRKKSLRLAFKSIYGPPKLDYPMFPDTPVTGFNKLRLRASHNKSWSYSGMRADYIRDQWARDTQRDMGQVTSHGTYVQVYLNGLYWGLYNAVEQPEAEFAMAYFGGLEDDWDVLKPGEVEDGTRDAWTTAHDLAAAGLESPAAYAQLRQYVDVDNLVDYMLLNFHAGTVDWDDSNWYAARKRAPGEGFRFFSWDTEQSMEFVTSMRVGVHNVGAPSSLYTALRANGEFRVLFGDHAHRHLFHDGVLTARSAAARYAARVTEIEDAIVGESARWGDVTRPKDPFDRDSDWLKEIEWLRLAYFPRRSEILLRQLRDSGLYPVLDAPVLEPFGGHAATATLGGGCAAAYYTTDGSDPRLEGGAVAPSAIPYGGPIVVAATTTIRARCHDGGAWSALEEATFVPEIAVRVSELMYNPVAPPAPSPWVSDDFEFLELVNTGSSVVPLGGLRVTQGITFAFPVRDLAPGETVLAVRNVAAFESRHGSGLPVIGTYSGKLANEGERLRVETVAGDEVLDFTWDDAWVPATDGGGHSLVVRDAAQDRTAWSRPAGWRASTLAGGSPGAPEQPACSDGVDNDGDLAIDHPADAGCASAGQDSEDPACSNGADDDADGFVDGADAHCDDPADADERAAEIDSFLCREVASLDDGDTTAGTAVGVDDALESGRAFELRSARALCEPATVNDEDLAPRDSSVHLLGFTMREADGLDSPPQAGTFVRSLGPLFLDTYAPDRLLIPAAVDTGAPVAAPDPAGHAVDGFACYRAKPTKGLPAYFPRGVQLLVRTADRVARYELRKPTRLCYAASVDAAALENDAALLTCYQAAIVRGGNDVPTAPTLFVGAASGPSRVAIGRVTELCVPAVE